MPAPFPPRTGANESTAAHKAVRAFVGHVLVSLPSAACAAAAHRALIAGLQAKQAAATLPPNVQITSYTDTQMLHLVDQAMQSASPLADLGQDLNLLRAQRSLAQAGYHWLLVKVADAHQATQVAGIVAAFGAERAQYHRRFIVEELIAHASDLPQVAESPDRHLDAQTRSGEELARARRDLIADPPQVAPEAESQISTPSPPPPAGTSPG